MTVVKSINQNAAERLSTGQGASVNLNLAAAIGVQESRRGTVASEANRAKIYQTLLESKDLKLNKEELDVLFESVAFLNKEQQKELLINLSKQEGFLYSPGKFHEGEKGTEEAVRNYQLVRAARILTESLLVERSTGEKEIIGSIRRENYHQGLSLFAKKVEENIRAQQLKEKQRLNDLSFLQRTLEQIGNAVKPVSYDIAEILSLSAISAGALVVQCANFLTAFKFNKTLGWNSVTSNGIAVVQNVFNQNSPYGSLVTREDGLKLESWHQLITSPIWAGLTAGKAVTSVFFAGIMAGVDSLRIEYGMFSKGVSYSKFLELQQTDEDIRQQKDLFYLGLTVCLSFLSVRNIKAANRVNNLSSTVDAVGKSPSRFKAIFKNPWVQVLAPSVGMSAAASLGEQLLKLENGLSDFKVRDFISDTIYGTANSQVFMGSLQGVGYLYLKVRSGLSSATVNASFAAGNMQSLEQAALEKYFRMSKKFQLFRSTLDIADGLSDVWETILNDLGRISLDKDNLSSFLKAMRVLGFSLKFGSAVYDTMDIKDALGDSSVKASKKQDLLLPEPTSSLMKLELVSKIKIEKTFNLEKADRAIACRYDAESRILYVDNGENLTVLYALLGGEKKKVAAFYERSLDLMVLPELSENASEEELAFHQSLKAHELRHRWAKLSPSQLARKTEVERKVEIRAHYQEAMELRKLGFVREEMAVGVVLRRLSLSEREVELDKKTKDELLKKVEKRVDRKYREKDFIGDLAASDDSTNDPAANQRNEDLITDFKLAVDNNDFQTKELFQNVCIQNTEISALLQCLNYLLDKGKEDLVLGFFSDPTIFSIVRTRMVSGFYRPEQYFETLEFVIKVAVFCGKGNRRASNLANLINSQNLHQAIVLAIIEEGDRDQLEDRQERAEQVLLLAGEYLSLGKLLECQALLSYTFVDLHQPTLKIIEDFRNFREALVHGNHEIAIAYLRKHIDSLQLIAEQRNFLLMSMKNILSSDVGFRNIIVAHNLSNLVDVIAHIKEHPALWLAAVALPSGVNQIAAVEEETLSLYEVREDREEINEIGLDISTLKKIAQEKKSIDSDLERLLSGSIADIEEAVVRGEDFYLRAAPFSLLGSDLEEHDRNTQQIVDSLGLITKNNLVKYELLVMATEAILKALDAENFNLAAKVLYVFGLDGELFIELITPRLERNTEATLLELKKINGFLLSIKKKIPGAFTPQQVSRFLKKLFRNDPICQDIIVNYYRVCSIEDRINFPLSFLHEETLMREELIEACAEAVIALIEKGSKIEDLFKYLSHLAGNTSTFFCDQLIIICREKIYQRTLTALEKKEEIEAVVNFITSIKFTSKKRAESLMLLLKYLNIRGIQLSAAILRNKADQDFIKRIEKFALGLLESGNKEASFFVLSLYDPAFILKAEQALSYFQEFVQCARGQVSREVVERELEGVTDRRIEGFLMNWLGKTISDQNLISELYRLDQHGIISRILKQSLMQARSILRDNVCSASTREILWFSFALRQIPAFVEIIEDRQLINFSDEEALSLELFTAFYRSHQELFLLETNQAELSFDKEDKGNVRVDLNISKKYLDLDLLRGEDKDKKQALRIVQEAILESCANQEVEKGYNYRLPKRFNDAALQAFKEALEKGDVALAVSLFSTFILEDFILAHEIDVMIPLRKWLIDQLEADHWQVVKTFYEVISNRKVLETNVPKGIGIYRASEILQTIFADSRVQELLLQLVINDLQGNQNRIPLNLIVGSLQDSGNFKSALASKVLDLCDESKTLNELLSFFKYLLVEQADNLIDSEITPVLKDRNVRVAVLQKLEATFSQGRVEDIISLIEAEIFDGVIATRFSEYMNSLDFPARENFERECKLRAKKLLIQGKTEVVATLLSCVDPSILEKLNEVETNLAVFYHSLKQYDVVEAIETFARLCAEDEETQSWLKIYLHRNKHIHVLLVENRLQKPSQMLEHLLNNPWEWIELIKKVTPINGGLGQKRFISSNGVNGYLRESLSGKVCHVSSYELLRELYVSTRTNVIINESKGTVFYADAEDIARAESMDVDAFFDPFSNTIIVPENIALNKKPTRYSALCKAIFSVHELKHLEIQEQRREGEEISYEQEEVLVWQAAAAKAREHGIKIDFSTKVPQFVEVETAVDVLLRNIFRTRTSSTAAENYDNFLSKLRGEYQDEAVLEKIDAVIANDIENCERLLQHQVELPTEEVIREFVRGRYDLATRPIASLGAENQSLSFEAVPELSLPKIELAPFVPFAETDLEMFTGAEILPALYRHSESSIEKHRLLLIYGKLVDKSVSKIVYIDGQAKFIIARAKKNDASMEYLVIYPYPEKLDGQTSPLETSFLFERAADLGSEVGGPWMSYEASIASLRIHSSESLNWSRIQNLQGSFSLRKLSEIKLYVKSCLSYSILHNWIEGHFGSNELHCVDEAERPLAMNALAKLDDFCRTKKEKDILNAIRSRFNSDGSVILRDSELSLIQQLEEASIKWLVLKAKPLSNLSGYVLTIDYLDRLNITKDALPKDLIEFVRFLEKLVNSIRTTLSMDMSVINLSLLAEYFSRGYLMITIDLEDLRIELTDLGRNRIMIQGSKEYVQRKTKFIKALLLMANQLGYEYQNAEIQADGRIFLKSTSLVFEKKCTTLG